MMAETPMRSANIHTAKVLMNCMRIEIGMSRAAAVSRKYKWASRNPAMTPPPHVKVNIGATLQPEKEPVIAAAAAIRYTSSALASLNKLSPSRMTDTRYGGLTRRSTAMAAEASGGDTMARA